MRTLLLYVFALLLVGGLLFLAASFAFGRDEELAPALPEGTPVELPDDRFATGEDLRALRLAVVLRGYRMEEVDWVLDRLAEQVDSRDREIARLRSVLHVEPLPAPDGAGAALGRGEEDVRLAAPDAPVPVPADIPARAASPDRRRSEPPVRSDGPVRSDAPVRAEAPVRADPPVRDSPGRTDGPVRVEPPVRDRLAGPGTDPVRGLRPDAPPDRDQR